MREPSFSQEQPRSLLLPVVGAVGLPAVLLAVAWHFYQPPKVVLTVVRTEILPTTSVFGSNSIVVGVNEVNNTLFVATTIQVENKRQYPVSLDDFTLTLTDATGAQMTPTAVTRQDLPNVEVEFPKLKPMAGTPLFPDVSIDAGKSVEGTLVFSMRIPQAAWDGRTSAELNVDVYHVGLLHAVVPK